MKLTLMAVLLFISRNFVLSYLDTKRGTLIRATASNNYIIKGSFTRCEYSTAAFGRPLCAVQLFIEKSPS